MGFAGLNFEEELVREFKFKPDELGIRDADVFKVSQDRLRLAGSKTCHFVITLTSHTPFYLVPPAEREIYPEESGVAEGYFNSMRYLDTRLRQYLEGLPDGTTVVIYGDHSSGIETDDYRSDRQGAFDFVPGYIYRKGVDLAAGQQTRDKPLARDGELTVADVMNFVRHQVQPENTRSPRVAP
jgi:phosphoglycerol transferase MdoB-like AlkP superfamily enzyme